MDETRIRLWRPLSDTAPDGGPPKEEPCATLTYRGVTFEIPYTLMHAMPGLIAMGRKDAGNIAFHQCNRLLRALEYLASVMGFDAAEHTQVTIDFYTAHGLWRGRPDIADVFPEAAEEGARNKRREP